MAKDVDLFLRSTYFLHLLRYVTPYCKKTVSNGDAILVSIDLFSLEQVKDNDTLKIQAT